MIQEEVQKYIVRNKNNQISPKLSYQKAMRSGLNERDRRIIWDEAVKMITGGTQLPEGDKLAMMEMEQRGYSPPDKDLMQTITPKEMKKRGWYNARSGVYKDPHRDDGRMDAGRYSSTKMTPMHNANFSSDPMNIQAENPVSMDGGTMERVPRVQHGPYPLTSETGERVDFKEGLPVSIPNPYSMQGSSRAPAPPPIVAPEMGQSIQEMISTADPSVLIPLPPEVSRGQTLGADAYSQMPPPQDLSGETLEAPPWPLVPPPVQPLPPPEQPAPPKPAALAPQFNMQNNLQPREQGIMEDYDRTDPSVLEAPAPQQAATKVERFPSWINTAANIQPMESEKLAPDISGQNRESVFAPFQPSEVGRVPPVHGQSNAQNLFDQNYVLPPLAIEGQPITGEDISLASSSPRENISLAEMRKLILSGDYRTGLADSSNPMKRINPNLSKPIPTFKAGAEQAYDQLTMPSNEGSEDVPGSFAEMQQQLLDEPLPQQQPYGLIGQPLQTNESPPLISTPSKGADSYNMEKNIPSAPYNMTEGLFNITEGLEPTPEEFHARAMKKSQARNDNIDFHAKAKQRAVQKALGGVESGQRTWPEDITKRGDNAKGGMGVSKEKLAELDRKLKDISPDYGKTKDGYTAKDVMPEVRKGERALAAKGKAKGRGVGSKTMADIKKDGAAEVKKTDTPKEAGKKITEDVISQMAGVGGDKWEGFIPALDNAIKELQRVAAGEDPYDIARARIARSSRRTLAGTEYSAKSEAAQAVRNKTSKSLKGGLDAAVATGKEVGRVTDKRAAKEEGASVKLFNSMTSSNFINWLEDPQNRIKMDENKLIGVAAQARLRVLQAAIAKNNSEKAKAEKERLEKIKKLLRNTNKAKKKSDDKKAKRVAKEEKERNAESPVKESAKNAGAEFTRNFDKAMTEKLAEGTPIGQWPAARTDFEKRKRAFQKDYRTAFSSNASKDTKRRPGQIRAILDPLDKRGDKLVSELRAWTP